MVQKRNLDENRDNDSGHPVQEPKRRLIFTRDLMSGNSLNEVSMIEPFIRNVVRDEVENTIRLWLHASSRASLDQNETSGGRSLHLCFVNRLPDKIFTNSRLESRDKNLVKIVLLDAATKNVVTSDPISSSKVEIFVLDGDFGSDDIENWSEKEFNDKILREREGRRPLLNGELVITLKGGVGYISNIIFTDNSSWIRSRKFRLGARIIQGNSYEGRIREARSEAFVVKDHRGELYKKHYPPALDDEIWRLEKIGKDGAYCNRLASYNIITVKDFVHMHVTDSASLRSMLGCGISNKNWEAITEHAASVADDGKWYMYYSAAHEARVLLNYILKVVGVIFEDQSFQTLDKLTFSEKRLVEDLKQQAYKNVKALIPIDEPSYISPALFFISPQAEPFINSIQQIDDYPVAPQDHLPTQLGFNFPSTSAAYAYEAEIGAQSEDSAAQKVQPMQFHIPTLRNSFRQLSFNGQNIIGGFGWSPVTSSFLVSESAQVATLENYQVEAPPCPPLTWEQGNALNFYSMNEAGVEIISSIPNINLQISRNRNPKIGWFKIRAAMKWGISVRRHVAAKRFAGLLY